MKHNQLLLALCALALFFANCKEEKDVDNCTPPPPPTATNNTPLEVGEVLRLTANGVAGATYSWTGPNGFKSTQQNPTIAGYGRHLDGEYRVTATLNGCTSDAFVTYVGSAEITASYNVGVITGQTLQLDVRTTNAMPDFIPVAFSWTGPNGFTSTLKNPTITNVTIQAAGIYIVYATDKNGKKSKEVLLDVVIDMVGPSISSNSIVNTDTIKVGGTLNLTATAPAGATFTWSGPNGFTSTDQNPTLPATKAAEGEYTCEYVISVDTIDYRSLISTMHVYVAYSNSGCNGEATVTHNGTTYNTVEIGNQCWLKENVKNAVGTDTINFSQMNSGSVVENQGVCPTGWHLPNELDWKTLALAVNGNANELKAVGQGTGNGAGTDGSGFSALLNMNYNHDRKGAIFWTTTETSTIASRPKAVQLLEDNNLIYFTTGNPVYGLQVRCIKD